MIFLQHSRDRALCSVDKLLQYVQHAEISKSTSETNFFKCPFLFSSLLWDDTLFIKIKFSLLHIITLLNRLFRRFKNLFSKWFYLAVISDLLACISVYLILFNHLFLMKYPGTRGRQLFQLAHSRRYAKLNQVFVTVILFMWCKQVFWRKCIWYRLFIYPFKETHF